jgi:hypothetical protein
MACSRIALAAAFSAAGLPHVKLRSSVRRAQVPQLDALHPAAAAGAVLSAGMVDEDAAHGLGRRGEEVNSSVPGLLRVGPDELEIRFMDQSRRLQGVARPLAGEALGGQPEQLLVDERQELLGGVGVSLLDGRQDARNVAHGRHRSLSRGNPMSIPPARSACADFSATLAATGAAANRWQIPGGPVFAGPLSRLNGGPKSATEYQPHPAGLPRPHGG